MKNYFIFCILFCLMYSSLSAQRKVSARNTKSQQLVSKNKPGGIVKKKTATKKTAATKKKSSSLASKKAVSRKKTTLVTHKTGTVARKRTGLSNTRKKTSHAIEHASSRTKLTAVSAKLFTGLTPEEEAFGTEMTLRRGKLPWPVEGEISIPFGIYTIEGTDIRGKNPGITITTLEKDVPVKAVCDGIVSRIDEDGEVATVFIRHGNYYSVYSNLSSIQVNRGALVKMGQSIGAVGEAYAAEGGELTFLLMKEKDNVNPTSWLSRNQ